MTTTITRIIRADWGVTLESIARGVVPAIALAYVAGMALGRLVHDLNDAIAGIVSDRPEESQEEAVGPDSDPEPAAPAEPATIRPALAVAATELANMTNRQLMELVGTRRRLPKRQLIAIAVGVA